ncbi:MAG: hypothetical protein ABI233_01485 [Chthoniobacterales bacterium]
MREGETSQLSESERARRYQGWSYTTDRNGEFTARFSQFWEYGYARATGIEAPGYGQFYFVASKESSAGAVSPSIEKYSPEEKKLYAIEASNSYGEGDEWRHDEFHPVFMQHGEQEALVLEFKHGLALKDA